MGLTIDYLRVGSPEDRNGITKVPIQFAFSGDVANATLTEDGTVITAREFYNSDYEFWVVPLAGTHTFDLSVDDWIPFYNAESKSITVTWSGTGGNTGGGDTGEACPKGNEYPTTLWERFAGCETKGYGLSTWAEDQYARCICKASPEGKVRTFNEMVNNLSTGAMILIAGVILVFLLRR